VAQGDAEEPAGPDPYVGPLVNSYVRQHDVNGLVLKWPKGSLDSGAGGNLAFSFPPGQEHAKFDEA